MKTDDPFTIPNFRITHARHDPAHCLIPGLFRSIDKSKARERVTLSYRFPNGTLIEVKMFEALGADDLRVLQGLLGMAPIQHHGKGTVILTSSPSSALGTELRKLMDVEDDAVDMDGCIVRCPYAELAREIGYANPRDVAPIRASIERLFMVTFFIQDGPKRLGFRLLSRCNSDVKGVAVALNPKLTEAIMGGQHVRLSMDEVRAFKTGPARLMHQRLCGWLQGNVLNRIDLDTLVSYAWPVITLSKGTHAKRRSTARKALLKEIGSLPGWLVAEKAKGKFEIIREKYIAPRSRRGKSVSSKR